MNTYLLTWNPKHWEWKMKADLSALKKRGFCDGDWSCGRTKRIEPGDRVFLLRQGFEPRGILASGQARSSPYYGPHWDENKAGQALYVKVRFDALLSPEEDGVLPLAHLRRGPLAGVHWSTQSSGISIPPKAALLLEKLWLAFLEANGQSPANTPEEVSTPTLYFEGACRTIAVNAYERDPRARKACIEHYGKSCIVCGFNFEARYGEFGRGYIHVHHMVPLSEVRGRYVVNPVRDLRPVCPNCHAMLHRCETPISVKELQKLLKNK